MRKIKNLALKINRRKVPGRKAADFKRWLEGQGRNVTVMGDRENTAPAGTDLVIVMGGDGTLLGGARAAAAARAPVIGIDFGGLGFLSEVKEKDAKTTLEKVFRGGYFLEKRMMIDCSILRAGPPLPSHLAINDVVISKTTGRLLRLKVAINGEYFHEYPGDGLILSTSTGSTAYSLSAGGPIVSPALDVIIITPICPHTLFARSIVTAGADVVEVNVPHSRGDVIMTLDGQVEIRLEAGDMLKVKRSSRSAMLVRTREPDFYSTVRDKFRLT
ncbi:MAG: NAD(+)/NADH kinase [bacterium]